MDGGNCAVPLDAPLEAYVPKGRPFHLRVSALDHGGSHAFVSPMTLYFETP